MSFISGMFVGVGVETHCIQGLSMTSEDATFTALLVVGMSILIGHVFVYCHDLIWKYTKLGASGTAFGTMRAFKAATKFGQEQWQEQKRRKLRKPNRVLQEAKIGLRLMQQAAKEDPEFWARVFPYVNVMITESDCEFDRLIAAKRRFELQIDRIEKNTIELEGVHFTSNAKDNAADLKKRVDHIENLLLLIVAMIRDSHDDMYCIDADKHVAREYAYEKRDEFVNDFRVLLDDIELTIGASPARSRSERIRRDDEQMQLLTTGELLKARAFDEINELLDRHGLETIHSAEEVDLQRIREMADESAEAHRQVRRAPQKTGA